MNIELRHLQLVYNIVHLGSLSKCAERMHITQPAASHLLKNIEDQLGISLFHRINKKMIITKAGNILLQAANDILPKIEQYKHLLKNEIEGVKGLVKISTQCYTSYNWLPFVLSSFNQLYPNIDVDLVTEATDNPHKYLLEGKIDLAVMIDPVPDNNLLFFDLFEDEVLLVVPKGHNLQSRKYVTAADIANENYIMYKQAFEKNSVAKDILIPARVKPKKIMKLQLTEAIVEMVSAGMGVTPMSNWFLKPFLKKRDLLGIKITKKGYFGKWSIVSLKRNDTPNYLSDFINFFQKKAVSEYI
jgi:LysR family transcriptional regulator for metE and metH